MENEKLFITASAISCSEQMLEKSDVFMLVKFRLVDTRPNLNHQGVTQKFIDDMISRKDQLIGLPLYCDVERLLKHDYEHLGHMLDEDGTFHSTQIGSMTDFEKANDGGVSAIISTARIPKREYEICDCIRQLFEMDALKFSFEISYNPDCTVQNNGVVFVDGSPDNTLTGVAVVSIPACESSCALQMVAERNAETNEGVEQDMDKEQMESAIAEAVAAKEAEMAQAIAEKDAVIEERDRQIAELNQALAEKPMPEEKPEEEDATAECKKEIEAECKKDAEAECKKDAEAECKKEAKAEADPEEMKDEEKACAEDKKEACAEVATAGRYEMECMQEEINRLRVELAAAAAAKAELEAIKAEMAAKELEANQAIAKAFAEKQGLDVSDENVAKAIAGVDYKMIAELSMKDAVVSPVQEKVITASIAGDGFEIKGGKYDDLLASRN